MVRAEEIRSIDDSPAMVADGRPLVETVVNAKLPRISSIGINNEKAKVIGVVSDINDAVIRSPRDSVTAIQPSRGDLLCIVRGFGQTYPDFANRILLRGYDRAAVRRH